MNTAPLSARIQYAFDNYLSRDRVVVLSEGRRSAAMLSPRAEITR